jgi:hypothetical protein
MERTLGPRDVGGILKETFIIYKNNFWKLTTIISIVAVPFTVLGTIIELLFPSYEKGTTAALTNSIISIPLGIAAFVVFTLAAGAIIYVVCQQYFNQVLDTGHAYSFAKRKLGTMVGAYLLIILAFIGLSITIIGIPFAIYFLITWTFVWQAVLLEDCDARDSLSHSSILVKHSWWRVFGIMLLFGLILATISLILSAPAVIGTAIWTIPHVMTGTISTQLPTWIMIVTQIGSLIGTIITVPIYTIGETLLYFDLRVREQGYNLDALAGELGLPGTAAEATVSPPQ